MSSPRPEASGRPAARLDGERSRTRILDVAERLFAEKGFSGTSIAAISRGSGLPASSLYWFFSSKRELMMAVVERAAHRFLTDFEKPDAPGEAPSLRSLMERGLLRFGSRLPDFLRLRYLLVLEHGDSEPELQERFRGASDRINELMAQAIEGSLAARSISGTRELAVELAPLALSLCNGALINLHVEPGAFEAERLPEDLETAVLALAESRLAQGAA